MKNVKIPFRHTDLWNNADAIGKRRNKSQKDRIDVELQRRCLLEITHVKYHQQTIYGQWAFPTCIETKTDRLYWP